MASQDAPHVTITVPFPDSGTLIACTCGHREECEVHTAAADRVKHAIRHAPWNQRPSKGTRERQP